MRTDDTVETNPKNDLKMSVSTYWGKILDLRHDISFIIVFFIAA